MLRSAIIIGSWKILRRSRCLIIYESACQAQVVEERIYDCLVGGSGLETLFMRGTISVSDVWV